MEPSPADLLQIACRAVGPGRIVQTWRWPHGESVVLHVRGADRDVIAKWVRSPARFERERAALREVCPALGADCSQLLVADEAAQVLVLTYVGGELVEGTAAASAEGTHAAAGALTARLHSAVPARPDEGRFARWLTGSYDEWAQRAAGLVDAARLAAARTVCRTVHELGPLELVPVHGDNTPRNWLLEDSGRLRFIDFGQARWQPWPLDVHRLQQRQWLDRPDLAGAFFAGYGRRLTAADAVLLRAKSAQGAVSTIARATEHGDAAFAQEGRQQLARLLEP